MQCVNEAERDVGDASDGVSNDASDDASDELKQLRAALLQHGPRIREALLFYKRYASVSGTGNRTRKALKFIEREAKLEHLVLSGPTIVKAVRR